MADIQMAVQSIVRKACEENDEFVFSTLFPYIEKELQYRISKAELERAISLLRTRDGLWISVKESLPQKSGEYLAAFVPRQYCMTVRYSTKHKLFNANDDDDAEAAEKYCFRDVSHWMPLPPLPKEGE